MKNRFTLLLLLSCLIIGGLQAQNIQLIMSPNPSPYISDWSSRTETASLIISNTTGNDIQVKLKTEIFDGKGSVIANTENGKMPILTVSPGVNRYSPEDIIPGNAVSYKGALATATMKTGKIPEDNYKICVALIDPKTFAPVGTSGTVCKFFKVVSYQAPVLLNPRNNESITETGMKSMMFRWSPIVPAPSTVVTYRLQIWEVLPGQDAMTALRSNQPIVEKDLKGILQTQWPIDFPLPSMAKEDRPFVWTVIALDNEGRKLVDGLGMAEPFVFKSRSAGCGTNEDSVVVKCGGLVNGIQSYGVTIFFTNIPPNAGGNLCTTQMNTITSTTGSISGITALPVTIPVGGNSPVVTFNYSPNVGSSTALFNYTGIWNDGNNNSSNFNSGNIPLLSCLCNDCDSLEVKFDNLKIKSTNGQYALDGNINVNRPIYGIEFQLQSYTFSSNPSSCSNGVTSIEESGIFLLPSTINGIPVQIFNETASGSSASNNSASKIIKLVSDTPMNGNIPVNLIIGLPSPLAGLNKDCCKIDFNVCIKVKVFYEPDSCKSCVFKHCFEFNNSSTNQ